MADVHNKATRSKNMRAIGTRDTAIEKRIAGTSLLNALGQADENTRRSLIEQYMEAAWQLGTIDIKRPFFGEIGRNDAIQTSTWQAYLIERAKRSLNASPLANLDAAMFAAELGESAEALINNPLILHNTLHQIKNNQTAIGAVDSSPYISTSPRIDSPALTAS